MGESPTRPKGWQGGEKEERKEGGRKGGRMGRGGGGKEGERDQDRKAGKEERGKKRLCEGTWMLKAPPRRGSARGQVSMCIEDKKTDGVVWSHCIPLSWGSRHRGAFLLPGVHL